MPNLNILTDFNEICTKRSVSECMYHFMVLKMVRKTYQYGVRICSSVSRTAITDNIYGIRLQAVITIEMTKAHYNDVSIRIRLKMVTDVNVQVSMRSRNKRFFLLLFCTLFTYLFVTNKQHFWYYKVKLIFFCKILN